MPEGIVPPCPGAFDRSPSALSEIDQALALIGAAHWIEPFQDREAGRGLGSKHRMHFGERPVRVFDRADKQATDGKPRNIGCSAKLGDGYWGQAWAWFMNSWRSASITLD